MRNINLLSEWSTFDSVNTLSVKTPQTLIATT